MSNDPCIALFGILPILGIMIIIAVIYIGSKSNWH